MIVYARDDQLANIAIGDPSRLRPVGDGER